MLKQLTWLHLYAFVFLGSHAEAEIEKMKGDIMKAADHWR